LPSISLLGAHDELDSLRRFKARSQITLLIVVPRVTNCILKSDSIAKHATFPTVNRKGTSIGEIAIPMRAYEVMLLVVVYY
jgi:hypothetical protein